MPWRFGDIFDHVVPKLHQFGAVGQFEFVRESFGQMLVEAGCKIHGVTFLRHVNRDFIP